jgi:hypothetical protein
MAQRLGWPHSGHFCSSLIDASSICNVGTSA